MSAAAFRADALCSAFFCFDALRFQCRCCSANVQPPFFRGAKTSEEQDSDLFGLRSLPFLKALPIRPDFFGGITLGLLGIHVVKKAGKQKLKKWLFTLKSSPAQNEIFLWRDIVAHFLTPLQAHVSLRGA